MLVLKTGRVLPGMNHMMDDLFGANAMFDLAEHERAGASHFFRIAFHH